MIKKENKTMKLFTSVEEEIIEKMIKEKHAFRKLQKIIDFEKLISPYRKLYTPHYETELLVLYWNG